LHPSLGEGRALGEIEAPHYGKEGLGRLRKSSFGTFLQIAKEFVNYLT